MFWNFQFILKWLFSFVKFKRICVEKKHSLTTKICSPLKISTLFQLLVVDHADGSAGGGVHVRAAAVAVRGGRVRRHPAHGLRADPSVPRAETHVGLWVPWPQVQPLPPALRLYPLLPANGKYKHVRFSKYAQKMLNEKLAMLQVLYLALVLYAPAMALHQGKWHLFFSLLQTAAKFHNCQKLEV